MCRVFGKVNIALAVTTVAFLERESMERMVLYRVLTVLASGKPKSSPSFVQEENMVPFSRCDLPSALAPIFLLEQMD